MRAHSWMLRRSAARCAQAPSPRPVTRGESTPPSTETQKAKIDWLNATFPAPHMTVAGMVAFIGTCCTGSGKQLQSVNSEWVRFEVQLGNRDRVIPFEAMTEPDRFFAGAYPALEALIGAAAETIPTTQTETLTNLGHLLHHMRRCYGKALHQAQETCAVTPTELIEEMRVIGMPRRVDPAGVVAGLEWPQLQAQLRSYAT